MSREPKPTVVYVQAPPGKGNPGCRMVNGGCGCLLVSVCLLVLASLVVALVKH